VVVNASRTVIDAARRAYANVVVIAVTAPPEVLAERLKMRARASDGRAEDRLGRAVDSVTPDITILNVGRPEDHARRLVRAIKGE
jgi:ribose 1,5-bisphosphokinase